MDPMTFADRAGHRWRPRFDPAAVREARAAGVNLALLADRGPAAVSRILRPQNLGVLLYAACRSQVTEAGLSPEAFARLMTADEDTVTRAAVALLLAVVEAFPRSRFAEEGGPALVVMGATDALSREVLRWLE